MILWVCFTLGNIFGFRAESRSEGTRDPLLFAPGARALTPDQQDGVGEKPLLLLQKMAANTAIARIRLSAADGTFTADVEDALDDESVTEDETVL